MQTRENRERERPPQREGDKLKQGAESRGAMRCDVQLQHGLSSCFVRGNPLLAQRERHLLFKQHNLSCFGGFFFRFVSLAGCCGVGPYPLHSPAPILLLPPPPQGLLPTRVRLPHCCCVFVTDPHTTLDAVGVLAGGDGWRGAGVRGWRGLGDRVACDKADIFQSSLGSSYDSITTISCVLPSVL